jgi:hypothetical protein
LLVVVKYFDRKGSDPIVLIFQILINFVYNIAKSAFVVTVGIKRSDFMTQNRLASSPVKAEVTLTPSTVLRSIKS